MWLDGSFVTTKEEPGDVDVLVWFDSVAMQRLDQTAQIQAWRLLDIKNHDWLRQRYDIDLYSAPADDPQVRMYWRGCFGFIKETEEPKGIPQLTIAPHGTDSLA